VTVTTAFITLLQHSGAGLPIIDVVIPLTCAMRVGIVCLGLCALVFADVQQTIVTDRPRPNVQTTRLASLSHERNDDFASFSHPYFPNHGLRIKRVHDFCDSTVNVYAGYLDIISAGSKVLLWLALELFVWLMTMQHLFFWFFESRNDPARDDVIMWVNGGESDELSESKDMKLSPD
jgi:hypothetical protein